MSAPPVFPADFPDPFVLNAGGGTYYAYGTNSGNINVQVLSSTDLATWQRQGDALPALPSWAQRGNTWAPSVQPRGGGFVLYYTVREPRSGRQAISVATSSRPEGPYTDVTTAPLVFQLDLGGSIDPSPFVDADQTLYLLFKADSNALNQPSSLWIQRLTPDGVEVVGAASRLLVIDAAWETPLIEAPSLVRDGSTYYLFYSANWWNTAGYAIGYATADNVGGPFQKVTTTAPWFASDADVAGPGGQEFFFDDDGGLRMAYHGWEPGQVGYPRGARTLRLAQITYNGTTPVHS